MRFRRGPFLMLALVLLAFISSHAQWIEGASDKPEYLLFAKRDGGYSLVRLTDWAAKVFQVPQAPPLRAWCLGVMPNQRFAIALVPSDNHTADKAFLEVIDLEAGRSVLIADPESQTHIGRYIDDVFMRTGDQDHIYVLFSNTYNYGSAQSAIVSNYDEGDWIMARLEPQTMKWERLAKPESKTNLIQIPDGGTSLPYMIRNARAEESLTKGGDVRSIMEKNKKDLGLSLFKEGILRAPPSFERKNILFYGEKYQVVSRDGTFALVQTVNGKSSILSECTKEKAQELGFEKELNGFRENATTAVIARQLGGF